MSSSVVLTVTLEFNLAVEDIPAVCCNVRDALEAWASNGPGLAPEDEEAFTTRIHVANETGSYTAGHTFASFYFNR